MTKMEKAEKLMTVDITVKAPGIDRSWLLISQLSEFVTENWQVIYAGAARLGISRKECRYMAESTSINRTRLEKYNGVTYANGHKREEVVGPSDEDIKATVLDIQCLIDAAAEDHGTLLTLNIKQG